MQGALQEPLLEERGPGRVSAAVYRAGQGLTPPIPWIEFTDENGRGAAVLTAFLLGVACSVGVLLLALVPSAAPFAVYFLLLVCFHMSEYLLTAAFRPDTLSFDNFLLNHSMLYQLMVVLAWLEYWAEWLLLDRSAEAGLGAMKQWGAFTALGLLLSLLGLLTRALGMVTASTNFSHKIEEERRREHMLVTHGIYSVLRHPAYFGFFWWSVGTQCLLANPICLVVYTAATWHFFYDRIRHEEELLIEFFGDSYQQYRKRSFIGIPFLT